MPIHGAYALRQCLLSPVKANVSITPKLQGVCVGEMNLAASMEEGALIKTS